MIARRCILFFAFLSYAIVFGQAVSQISGTVRDSTGAVVSGTVVTVIQTDQGTRRSMITDESGSFVLPNLALGPYRLEAAKPGFRTYTRTGIELQVDSNPTIPITLELGEVTDEVRVVADVAQVETRSVGVGTVVETQRILDLPLNGRDPTELITLNGAAVVTALSPSFDMRSGENIAVAGGSPYGVQYNLDGAPHLDYFDGQSALLPFPDALQEFKISTSAQDPTTSGHSAATVDAVTKSGSNSFHGDAFEFLRNYAVDARDFFATQQDGLKRNQFGGIIGGPIKKDKLFFFVGYQGSFVRQTPISSQTFVPTAQMLAGDFTTFASAACQNGKAVTLKAPFVNNQINPALLSPAAVDIAARLPTPLNNCGLVRFGIPLSEDDNQLPIRVDYQLNDKHTLFARYMFATQKAAVPYNLSSDNVLTGPGLGNNDQFNSVALGDTYLISATKVNAFRVSFDRIGVQSPGCDCFGPQDVGINMYSYLPTYMQMTVNGAFTLGAFGYNGFEHVTSFGANDNYTWVHGAHQISFGGSYTRAITWRLGNAYDGGAFTIAASTGLGLADFELGIVSQLHQGNPNYLNYSQNFFTSFIQDTWKITPRLTMTYGINYAPFTGLNFQHGDVFNFSLSSFYAGTRSTVIPTAPPGFTYPGDPGFPGKSGVNDQWGNADPRIGIAWDPFGDGKTAIRLGGGIGHDYIDGQLFANQESLAWPFALNVVSTGVSLANPYAGGDPFPYSYSGKYPTSAQIPCLATTCPPSFIAVPKDFKTEEQYSWNLAIQRQITPGWFLSATYLGTHLIHTTNTVELNPAIYVPGSCSAGQYGLSAAGLCTQSSNIAFRRVLNLANPNENPLGYITQIDDGGTQGYNGLLVATRWRLGEQVNLNANYTWSHCIGLGVTANSPPGGGQLNPGENYVNQGYGQNVFPVNRNLDVGDCYQDRRQMANITLVYQTPKFSNRMARLTGSYWKFSSTFVVNTGTPLTITDGVATDPATGFGGSTAQERPNLLLTNTASPTRGGACSAATFCVSWLNPAAFSAPVLGAYGNLGAGAVLGPGFWEWDEGVSRQFQIHEAQKLEVRFEAFNITNSFHPGNPGTTLGASTFGAITTDATPASGTTAPARVLQFAMKYFF